MSVGKKVLMGTLWLLLLMLLFGMADEKIEQFAVNCEDDLKKRRLIQRACARKPWIPHFYFVGFTILTTLITGKP
jgi:hypothetical protein